MKDIQALSYEKHKALGYAEKYGLEVGHNVGAVVIAPNEFSRAQREYPIFFRKESETGRFLPVVLLGFEEHENLFLLEDNSWNARYIPLSVRQGPFLIGLEQHGTEQCLAIYADLNDARIQEGVTPALFDTDGKASKTLEKIRSVLSERHKGTEFLEPMVKAFLKYELLERVVLEIDLASGATVKFDAGYTVHIEKLMSLDSAAVVELHKSGFLSLAYNVADSVNNIQALIDIKNAKMK